MISKDFWLSTAHTLQNLDYTADCRSGKHTYTNIQQPSYLWFSTRRQRRDGGAGSGYLAAVYMFSFSLLLLWPAQSVVSLIHWSWIHVFMSSLCLLLISAGAQTSYCTPMMSINLLPDLLFSFSSRTQRMHDQQRRLLPRLHGPTNRLRVPVPCRLSAPGQKDLWR